MSLPLVNKIMQRQRQTQQKISQRCQNKENRKENRKKQKSGRQRNDHSIEAKSPIKVPFTSIKKEDLTFRNHMEILASSSSIVEPNQFNMTMQSDLASHLNKEEMKITLTTIATVQKPRNKCISQAQCQLIDNLWQICTRLNTFKTQCIEQPLNNIQLQIKKILTIIAQQNLDNQAPLASSKKIKLQKCLAHSQCDKEIDQKEFESDQSLVNSQLGEVEQILSRKTFKSEESSKNQLQVPKRHQSKNNKMQKQELQMKKIMYMLDGKQKNGQKVKKNETHTESRNSNESLSSFSSFNRNSNDQSGFTVYEIQRYSGRSQSISQDQKYQSHQDLEKIFKKSNKNYHQQEQSSRNYKKRSQTEANQSYSSRSSNMNSQANSCVGNKRKVLNDIVAMLNHKYNKNIRLD